MANGHGGARPGAGRKKKALSEKIMDGNPGKAPLTKLQFEIQKTDMHGEDMPPVAEYLKQVTKNSQQNLAPQIYEDTWRWLNERGCAIYVKKELIEQYALYMQRWIQCEEGIIFRLFYGKASTNMDCLPSTRPHNCRSPARM